FEDLPEGGDLYLLKGIIHGFSDDDALRLLRSCRRAIKPNGRLMIIETVPRQTDETYPQKAFMDLMMLALTPGKERSEAELRPLLGEAGFKIVDVLPTPGPSSLVVCGISSDRG
ncbi:MAG: methyltransferase, partial [Acidobacteriota bacterium]|nr:methyltransferase [Acidobacteriota bacterium]